MDIHIDEVQTRLNTLRQRQNGRHFADDTLKRIFLKENIRISIKISLMFVPKSPIDNIPSLFQIMTWRWPGDKPLSEAMMVSLLMHICIARPQWVKWNGYYVDTWAPFINMNWLKSQHGWVITSIIKCGKINLPIPKLQCFIPQYTGHAITYPCWD